MPRPAQRQGRAGPLDGRPAHAHPEPAQHGEGEPTACLAARPLLGERERARRGRRLRQPARRHRRQLEALEGVGGARAARDAAAAHRLEEPRRLPAAAHHARDPPRPHDPRLAHVGHGRPRQPLRRGDQLRPAALIRGLGARGAHLLPALAGRRRDRRGACVLAGACAMAAHAAVPAGVGAAVERRWGVVARAGGGAPHSGGVPERR